MGLQKPFAGAGRLRPPRNARPPAGGPTVAVTVDPAQDRDLSLRVIGRDPGPGRGRDSLYHHHDPSHDDLQMIIVQVTVFTVLVEQ